MKKLFSIDSAVLGDGGAAVYAWAANGQLLAAAGVKRKVVTHQRSREVLQ